MSNPYPETRIERLRTIAVLFGLDAPPVERCRVLELGCAAGGNLIPMACAFPQSHHIGIDLSARQIEDASASAAALRLANIEFRHLSITDITPDFGQFDYILCHGVFSWVPRAVQEKIFAIFRENLSERGVAFVSFNTYPGWHFRQWMRDMMLFAARGEEPRERINQARAFLDLVSDCPFGDEHLRQWLKGEIEMLAGKPDAYVVHEYLEDCNQPMYLSDFMAMAAGFGLQYLGDARQNGAIVEQSWPEVRKLIEQANGDVVRIEQCTDFLRNRTFRRALLCHNGIALTREGAAARVPQMWIASSLRSETPSPLRSPQPVKFTSPRGSYTKTENPAVIAALLHLGEQFPQSIAFTDLSRHVQSVLALADADFTAHRQRLSEELLRLWMTELVELHISPPHFVTHVSDRPAASALARFQGSRGDCVTNLRHELVRLDASYRAILPLMDGMHSRDELARKLLESGVLKLAPNLRLHLRKAAAMEALDEMLRLMASQALLES